MWAAIIALFPTIAGWINSIVGWFQANAAEQTAADSAEQTAEQEHEDDGAQSVADQQSDQQQEQELQNIANQEDNPTQVVVTKGSSS